MVYEKNIKRVMVIIFMITSGASVYAARFISGDNKVKDATFQFAVDQHDSYRRGELIFVTARADQGGNGRVNEYAIAQKLRDQPAFFGSCTPMAYINNSAETLPNPLYDAGILHVSHIADNTITAWNANPILVTAQEPNIVRMVRDRSAGSMSLYQTPRLGDAFGEISKKIVGLATSRYMIFAAVTSHNSDVFGLSGSGISAIIFGQQTEIKSDDNGMQVSSVREVFAPVNTAPNTQSERNGRGIALPLDITSPYIKIGSKLQQALLGDMYWSEEMQRLYIALDVKTGREKTDGACAVVVGRIERQQLYLEPIVATSAINASTIVGVSGAHKQLTIQKVRTMITTTRLPYLIVQGGLHGRDAVKRSVYAQPLLNSGKAKAHGTIAAGSAQHRDRFVKKTSFLRGRLVVDKAERPEQMLTYNDQRAIVGGSVSLSADITDMYVAADAVYITTEDGVYSSQALFDADGKIMCWTDWRQEIPTLNASDDERVHGLFLDERSAKKVIMSTKESVDGQVTCIRETSWDAKDLPGELPDMVKSVNKAFSSVVGGIKCCKELSLSHDGTMATIFAAQGKIVLSLEPNHYRMWSSESCGQVGFIHSITSMRLGDDVYVCVGGADGITVLCDANGRGLSYMASTADQIAQLSTMRWRMVGSFDRVKKIIGQQEQLFVVQEKSLYRVDFSALLQGDAQPIPLFSCDVFYKKNPYATICDAIVSYGLGLITTTEGVYRIGNGKDIRTIDAASIDDWQNIVLPLMSGVPGHIYSVAQNNNEQCVAGGVGGYVCIMVNNRLSDKSMIYRLAIKNCDTRPIDAKSVQLFPDTYNNRTNGYLTRTAKRCDKMVTDGGFFFFLHNMNEEKKALVYLLSRGLNASLASGSIYAGQATRALLLPIQNAHGYTNLIHSARGAWILTGDTGIQVHA